jgi:hypothetical protein
MLSMQLLVQASRVLTMAGVIQMSLMFLMVALMFVKRRMMWIPLLMVVETVKLVSQQDPLVMRSLLRAMKAEVAVVRRDLEKTGPSQLQASSHRAYPM